MNIYLKFLIGAVLIGITWAIIFYQDINREVKAITKKEDIIYIFQGGVYSNLENANAYIKRENLGIIYQDDDFFRTFIGVVKNTNAKEKLEDYFSRRNIPFYIKEMRVNNKLINELSSYENILIKTASDEVLLSINSNMLNILASYLS